MTRFRTLELSAPEFEADGLRLCTVASPALQRRGDLSVYGPEQARECPSVPIVVLLHGVYGSHWSWSLQAGAHRTARRMIDTGKLRPVVLAMPSDGLWGDGSGYLRHANADYERWIVEDVVDAACEVVPTADASSPVAIAGLSMGGYGALRIAAHHPCRFVAACGLSSITEFAQLAEFVEGELDQYGEDSGDRSILDALLAHRDELPAIRFDCGTEDPLLEGNRALHRALTEAGIEHQYAEYPGGHEWEYWREHLVDALDFIEHQLAARGSS